MTLQNFLVSMKLTELWTELTEMTIFDFEWLKLIWYAWWRKCMIDLDVEYWWVLRRFGCWILMSIEKLNYWGVSWFIVYVEYLIDWNLPWICLIHWMWFVMIIKCCTYKNPLYDHLFEICVNISDINCLTLM